MSSAGEPDTTTHAPSVFVSYASEDREAARSLRDALAANGLDVWYDENELGGGDAWDHKIRRQIRDCTFFMPIISARTEARHEGYFRREWRLAVERTLDMADDVTFLLPIVIDGTNQATARVPEKFLSVQWLPVPGGVPTPGFNALCRRLFGGNAAPPPVPKPAARRPSSVPPPPPASKAGKAAPVYPPFPHEEPGQKLRYIAMMIGWCLRAFPTWFRSLPRWIRWLVIFCLVCGALDRCGGSHKDEGAPGAKAGLADRGKPALNDEQSKIIRAYTVDLKDVHSLSDLVRVSQKMTEDMSKSGASDKKPKMAAIPFSNPSGDPAAAAQAEQIFTKVVTTLQTAYPTSFSISATPLTTMDPVEAKQRAKELQVPYLLYGAIEGTGPTAQLAVTVMSAADSDDTWSKSYPLVGLDEAATVAEIFKHASDDED